MVKYVSESSQGFTQWRPEVLALQGGMNMVTFEALTCMFTFGMLLVAMFALISGKK